MTTAAEAAVYPLSDPRGNIIPFDVGAPEGVWITAIGAAASAEKTLPSTWSLVVLWSTVDCLVGFGSAITLNTTQDTEKVDHQYVPANVPCTIALPSLKFKVIRTGTVDGILYVQKYRVWRSASQSVQIGKL